jgi:hypothetical protein
LEAYWARDPYENAIAKPSLRTHANFKQYNLVFKLRSELPSKGLLFITKILGSKKMKKDA